MSGHIKIRDLELVVALHEERNLTQAAKRIGISEPAFSKRLQLIEKRVQAKLFVRGSEGSEATSAGNAFLERARTCVQAFYQAVNDAQQAKYGESYKLRIGVSAFLPPRLIELIRTTELRLYRNLCTEIITGYSMEILSMLQRHEIELALITSPPESALITSSHVSVDPFMIVFRADHPLANHTSLTLSEASAFPWVFFNRHVHPPLHDQILQRVRAAQLRANIIHHISQADQVAAFLTDNHVLAWLTPSGAGRVARDGLVKVPLMDEQIRLETHFATQASNSSRLVSEFYRTFMIRIRDVTSSTQLHLPIE